MNRIQQAVSDNRFHISDNEAFSIAHHLRVAAKHYDDLAASIRFHELPTWEPLAKTFDEQARQSERFAAIFEGGE